MVSGNLCRRTGYDKITRAVMDAAFEMRNEMDQITPKPIKQFKVIGTRPLRPDGIEKVTGKAIYGADLSAPNMLYGLMLRINESHALIENIDISIAEKLPGVKSMILSKTL